MNINKFELYETVSASADITSSVTKTNTIQGFEFQTPKRVSNISFNLNNTTALPTISKIEGYNETSSQWEDIAYTGTIALGSNQLTLNNTKAYRQFRINLSFDQASTVNLTNLTIYGND